MTYLRSQSNYNKFPHIEVKGHETESWQGWNDICNAIATKLARRKSGLARRKSGLAGRKNRLVDQQNNQNVLVIDMYPGVDKQGVINVLQSTFAIPLKAGLGDITVSIEVDH